MPQHTHTLDEGSPFDIIIGLLKIIDDILYTHTSYASTFSSTDVYV